MDHTPVNYRVSTLTSEIHVDNIQRPFEGLRELALFAGAGGGILGGHLLGWRTVCAVEYDAHAVEVLVQRQNDGSIPPFPIWDDVRTFDPDPWRGIVDVVSGGFPCQDISSAGRGKGITGEKSGLWKEFARIIRGIRPRYAFVENSPVLSTRGLDVVLGDLASLGYDAAWGVLGAADLGAPHQRDRMWIVAQHPDSVCVNGRQQPCSITSEVASLHGAGHGNGKGVSEKWFDREPEVGRLVNRVPRRVDELRRIGNAQVPAVAATAFYDLWKVLNP